MAAFEHVGTTQSHVWSVLKAIETGDLRGVTSEITLAELLLKLIVDGETELISLYKHLFSDHNVFDAVPTGLEILSEAARIRAGRMSIKLPDAIHLATAQHAGCFAILTNDRRLATPGGIPLVTIDPTSLDLLRSLNP
ncbi:type II toxin-antitoxin system VapC family toxin [Hyphomicrobiales bacterium BP6-180914]|uniref:Type II toxin-antitoxin system VapC family toxin n=1 Tax=Lichenifustis flavocetrariae TaxID=2949735 RepID=A0AA42CHA9_9HYPH|nr:type II toxin-antitoxin system VapC family toxin [Lichenifustis flavocetrariae]